MSGQRIWPQKEVVIAPSRKKLLCCLQEEISATEDIVINYGIKSLLSM
jgi:hypothetical protein